MTDVCSIAENTFRPDTTYMKTTQTTPRDILITVCPFGGIADIAIVTPTRTTTITDAKLAGYCIVTGKRHATVDDMYEFEDNGGLISWKLV